MKYVKFVLSGTYRETGKQTKGIASATKKEGFRFDRFFLKTEIISRRKDVDKVLIDCRSDFTVSLFAGLEEIASRINLLKESGKEVFFYAHSYGVKELFLSSFCSYRLIHPLGSVKFQGLAQSFTFISRFTRRLGIEAEVIRRGEYKSAGDRFRTDRLEPSNREQYQFYLDTVMKSIKNAVATGFEKTSDDIELLLNGRFINATVAEDEDWIDEIVCCSEFINRWENDKSKELKFKKEPDKVKNGCSIKKQKIAILVFEGAIIDGYSKRDLIMGQAVGAESFIPEIQKLRDDKKVKAVVLRINSGGGSAFASEDITAELRLLAEKKPLVISMSEVAASGGYWMACCGIKTFALPTTLTGSIGVISIYLNWHRLLSKLGLTHDVIKIGEHSDLGSPLRSLTNKERNMVDKEIDEMYNSFLDTVSLARKTTKDEVSKLASGRVWPGITACDNGLVDEEGGLLSAILSAKEAANVKRPIYQFYPEIKLGLVEKLLFNSSKHDETATVLSDVSTSITELKHTANLCNIPLAVVEELLPVN